MKAPVLSFVRYGVPALMIVVGAVVFFLVDDRVEAFTGWAGFTGAGLAVLLLNVFYRIGASGDEERDEEAEAREYFDKHGRWPDP